ncbi:MAG: UDP-N-acetylmuramoyl-tripeptide--D-alanyl-D-alanine ligase [Planctomycetota bacterium]|nr:MAG: UDP-N-acetylmuramoyl-tripeptide--D-alanyl-D-alanine ligase [Planctomycetota bacterium]
MNPAPFPLDAGTAEALTGGTWHGRPREVVVRGAAIDSRQVRPGCLFAAIVGARVDGHDFAATAAGDGAALILTSRLVVAAAPVLVVEDVARALGQLAAAFRRHHRQATWIAVAGANGKTTVKELLAAAASEEAPTHATEGNRNNHLGVPLTILNTPAHTRWCVIELGANKAGEIAELAAMVQPDVAVCTSIGPAHLEGYGDLQGVALGESAVFAAVPPGAPCLFGRSGLEAVSRAGGVDARELEAIVRSQAAGRNLLVVGGESYPITGETRPDGIVMSCGEGQVQLPLLGHHNLANAHLAWRAAVAAGVIPELALRGLRRVVPVPGRLRLIHLGNGHRLFDDCYNANPASMSAGLQELARQPGARLAVLGAMGELGMDAPRMHGQLGAEAARLGLPILVVGGDLAQAIVEGYCQAGGRDYHLEAQHDGAIAFLQARLQVAVTAILVKASRSAGLDRIVSHLCEHYPQSVAEQANNGAWERSRC